MEWNTMGKLPEANFYAQISTPHSSSALTRLSISLGSLLAVPLLGNKIRESIRKGSVTEK